MLKDIGLHSKYQLAVRLLWDHYASLADFVLKRVLEVADLNGDKKTSFEEILGLSDTSIIKEFSRVLPASAVPGHYLRTIMECSVDLRYFNPKVSEDYIGMWLNVLYNILDNKNLT